LRYVATKRELIGNANHWLRFVGAVVIYQARIPTNSTGISARAGELSTAIASRGRDTAFVWSDAPNAGGD
jgi:hypothetical protein